jgi:uncharacterized membrane protein (DUF106 family)
MTLTPFLTITFLSLGLSLAITIIYRVLTKPDEMRKIKQDMKFYKEKMNQANKEGDRAKANEYAGEMLKSSQKQFRMSMKPMMATMLIFFLLLGWLHNNFGGVTADFSSGEDASFVYAEEEHAMYYEKGADEEGFRVGVDLNDDGTFNDEEVFSKNEVFSYGGAIWRPTATMVGLPFFQTEKEDSVHFEMFIAKMPFSLPLIGNYLTWFWWYIFISLPATFALRKLMGVE